MQQANSCASLGNLIVEDSSTFSRFLNAKKTVMVYIPNILIFLHQVQNTPSFCIITFRFTQCRLLSYRLNSSFHSEFDFENVPM